MSETEIEFRRDLEAEILRLLENKSLAFHPNADDFIKSVYELPIAKRIAETPDFVDVIDVSIDTETRTINVKFTLPVPVEINYEGDFSCE